MLGMLQEVKTSAASSWLNGPWPELLLAAFPPYSLLFLPPSLIPSVVEKIHPLTPSFKGLAVLFCVVSVCCFLSSWFITKKKKKLILVELHAPAIKRWENYFSKLCSFPVKEPTWPASELPH
jgi:hypothetical protein